MYRIRTQALWLVVGAVLVAGFGSVAGCITLYRKVTPRAVDPQNPPVEVTAPLKVHLLDGTTALFATGASFDADSLRGEGLRFGLDLRSDTTGTPVRAVPLDSVAALETYQEGIRPIESLVVSSVGTAAATFGVALALVAIFGSCPTVYSGTGAAAVLEAEAFPNSIVPLFEMRDVDRLSVGVDANGRLDLDVRNEALETHYINHLELLAVTHPAGTWAVPGDDGEAWVLHDVTTPSRLHDRAGRDVSSLLAAADDAAFTSSEAILAAATPDDVTDYIEVELPAPASDTAAVYLRLRNSLLGTVFFYDFMLDGQGARSLNWMSRELNSVAGAVRLGDFYQRRMGLRVDLWKDGAYEEVERVREVGPIAWDHVAVPVPVPPGNTLRLRLRFITDAWRIDHLAVAERAELVKPHVLAPEEVRRSDGVDAALLAQLHRPDETYAVTTPGERFWIRFAPGPAPAGSDRTFFLASQGYYTEWVRGEWVRDDVAGHPFHATDTTLHAAIVQWREVKDAFEARFETSKIPVR